MAWEGLTTYNPDFDVYRAEYHELDSQQFQPLLAKLPERRQAFEDARQAYNGSRGKAPVPRELWPHYREQGRDPEDDGSREKGALVTAAAAYGTLVRDLSAVAADIANSRRDAMNLPDLVWLPGGEEGHRTQITQWDNLATNERTHARRLMEPYDFLQKERSYLEQAYTGGFRLVYPGSSRLNRA